MRVLAERQLRHRDTVATFGSASRLSVRNRRQTGRETYGVTLQSDDTLNKQLGVHWGSACKWSAYCWTGNLKYDALDSYDVPAIIAPQEPHREPVKEHEVLPCGVIWVQCRLASVSSVSRKEQNVSEMSEMSRTCILWPLTDLMLKPYSVTKIPRGNQESAKSVQRSRGRC